MRGETIKRILFNFFMQFLFWMMAFAIGRTIYLIYYIKVLIDLKAGFGHTLASYWHALHLDLATACYFMIFPFLVLLIQSVYSPRWLNLAHKIYTAIVLLTYAFIIGAELGIYQEWKTKLTYKALLYLSHPSEIYNSAETSTFFLLLAIVIVQVTVTWFLYIKVFFKPVIHHGRNLIFTICFLIFTPPLLVIGLRGGIQEIPIMQSESYYSSHQFLNLAATNSVFNLGGSARENYRYKDVNPFVAYPAQEAEQVVNDLFKTEKDTTISFLTTQTPNIVLLLMESWSADLIETLGGNPGITPAFRELEKGGLLFSSFYASGSRSEQGMSCVFAGFPAHPVSSIAVQPDKYNKLPSLTRELIDLGYHTSFYYGGQLIYGNIKSYIYYNGFETIKEIADFDPDLPRGKLGIHDEFILSAQLDDLEDEKSPFFSVLFTLSTHSPFDMPMAERKDWGYDAIMNDYLNSALYTDRCLEKYFTRAKEQPWFDSTLFIIVADHSHFSQFNWPYHTPQYHRIPLLFYGPVLKDEFRGQCIGRIGSQVDIAATLLSQLGINPGAFIWSKDLMNPYTPEFAGISFEEGIGWVCPEGHFFWDNRIKDFINNELTGDQDSIIRQGKSYLQVVYQNFLGY
jgi:phosphoglycerol transferase MdoB-like AlkP superfamily enzyme